MPDLKADDPEVLFWLEGVGKALTLVTEGIIGLMDDPNGDVGNVRGKVHDLSSELFKGFHLQHKNWNGEPLGTRSTFTSPLKAKPVSLDELA